MITLKDIFDNLTYGELSHLSIGNAPVGFIDPKDYPKIVAAVNNALTALHKRFLLRTEEVRVQELVAINTYYMRRAHAVSNTDDITSTKYILDSSAAPFSGSLFKIEAIVSDSTGAFILNDSSQANPVYTPNFDTFVITPTNPPETLKVALRSDHPRIVLETGFDPLLVELHIPYSLLDAISLNVAARLYSPLTAGDGERSAASVFMYKYEMECKRLEEEGMTLEADVSDTRFENKGFI